MGTEIWDVLDKTVSRPENASSVKRVCLLKGEYHLVVHIWILGSDGRVLIQRRSFTKAAYAW